jgi:hypothetical protein
MTLEEVIEESILEGLPMSILPGSVRIVVPS